MSIFFQDPNEVRLPPEDVRLKSVQIISVNNSGRVRIQLEVTPFQQRPNVEMTITNPTGEEVARTTILETMLPRLEFTMHIREFEADQEYSLNTYIYYQKLPQASKAQEDIELPNPMIVDEQMTKILLP